MKTYLDYEGIEVLAHRGGAEESYENTLESFEYSQSLGCKFIETDVQESSDGIPYIPNRLVKFDRAKYSLRGSVCNKGNWVF